jgi:hypothetical protein
MSITIDLPADAERKLADRAAKAGMTPSELARRMLLHDIASGPTFAELCGPVRQEFESSGQTEEQLEAAVQQELADMRREKREAVR